MESFCGKYSHNRDIYIYIYPQRDPQRDGIKMEWKRKLKGGGLYSLIYQPREFQTTIYDKLCFSSKMGGREGLLLAGGFICLLFLALHGCRSRASVLDRVDGNSPRDTALSLSPFLFSSFFFFSFFERRIGHDNDRFIGSRTHKRRVSTRRE